MKITRCINKLVFTLEFQGRPLKFEPDALAIHAAMKSFGVVNGSYLRKNGEDLLITDLPINGTQSILTLRDGATVSSTFIRTEELELCEQAELTISSKFHKVVKSTKTNLGHSLSLDPLDGKKALNELNLHLRRYGMEAVSLSKSVSFDKETLQQKDKRDSTQIRSIYFFPNQVEAKVRVTDCALFAAAYTSGIFGKKSYGFGALDVTA